MTRRRAYVLNVCGVVIELPSADTKLAPAGTEDTVIEVVLAPPNRKSVFSIVGMAMF